MLNINIVNYHPAGKAKLAHQAHGLWAQKRKQRVQTLGPGAVTQRRLWLSAASHTLLSHPRQAVVRAGEDKRERAREKRSWVSLQAGPSPSRPNPKCPGY